VEEDKVRFFSATHGLSRVGRLAGNPMCVGAHNAVKLFTQMNYKSRDESNDAN